MLFITTYSKIVNMFKWSKVDFVVLPITLIAIVLIATFLYFLLRNKEEKFKKIPLIFITCFMLLLEGIKQIKSFVEGYDYWTIPLHFCSLFIYFYPLAVFAKGKVKDFGKTMSLVCSVLMFSLFYFSPDSIIGSQTTANIFSNYEAFHTFTYHHLVMLFLFTSLFLDFYKFKEDNFVHVIIGFTLYAIIMIPLAHILDTNFCDILETGIPFLESLRLFAGQWVYTMSFYTFSIVAGIAIIALQRYIENKNNKINKI